MASGISSSGFGSVSSLLNGARIQDQVQKVVKDSLEEGVVEMREMVETRGTGRRWVGDWSRWPNAHPGRTASIPGRVASGSMRDGITSEVTSSSPSRTEGWFGWADGSPTAIESQELGFTHNITGQHVKGIQTLRDTRGLVEQMLIDRLRRMKIGN